MKTKIKKCSKSLIATLMSLLIILSAFPLTAFASTYITDMNSNAEFGVIDGSYGKYGHEMHYAKYDGKKYIVFCCQYGVTSPNGSTYEYGSDFRKYLNKSGDTYEKIATYISFGYTLQYGDGIPDTKAEWIAACCTQQFVWETLGVNPSRSSWDSTYMSDSLYKQWLSDTEDLIDTYYNKQPSFAGSTKSINLGGSTTLTDSNGVMKYYPTFSKTIDKVTFSHTKGENKLTISVDENCTNHSVKFKSSSYDIYMGLPTGDNYNSNTMNYVYFEFEKGSIQNLMFSNYVDPQFFALDVNVEFGNLKITKTSEDKIVEGITFTATGNGKTYTMTTDSSGTATLNNIPVGTYTIKENGITRYVAQATKTATVTDGKTANVSFNNILKKFRVTVKKLDIENTTAQGDATLAGATYGIYKGDTLVDTYTTDSNASFTTSYYVCDTDWTIKEISSSEGYLVNETSYKVGADPKLYTVEYNDTSNAVTEQVIKGKISIIKHTDDGSTQIETPEKGAEFQIYLKSAGSYANAKASEKDTIVCDEDGYASSKLLPYGVYTVHQTKGWDGREMIKDFDVFISTDGNTYKFLINNSNFESYLKVVKLDAETNKQIAYEGAGFEIYNSDGQRVSMQFTYPQVTSIHTFYTNSEGYLITPEKLPYGDYTLVEVQAPYGYVLDSTPISFTISQENSSTDTGVTVVKVKAKDVAQKGVIEITKSGEVFASVSETDNIYTPVYEVQNLKGAIYEIYANEDITTADGTVRAEKGTLVDTVTTDENGIAKSKELYLGKYLVKEKTAPDNFVLNTEEHLVELTYDGQDVKVTSTALSVYNERQKVSVSLSKTLEQDETFNVGNNGEILNVQFGIYVGEDVTAEDGTVIPKDGLIAIANCDENGNITFNCDLPIGFEWYVKEIATDKQYILSDEQYFFNTEYAGQDIETINIEINNGETIENKIIYGSIKGLKIDRETNETIEGAVFGLFKNDETEYNEKNAILTAITDKDGIFTFENVPYGDWIVKELQPADGYLANDEIHHITVSKNEQVIEFTVVNDKIPELKTTASIDGKKEITTQGEVTIIDVVEYKHLIPGKEYVISGVLMDKSTGKAFKVNGKAVTSEVTFTPENSNGTVEVTFTFDASGITKDTELVVFETLYRDGVELATHTNLDDEGQTVTIKVPTTTTPKTGDERNYGTWIGLGTVALGGAIAAVILKIKAKKDEDDD